MLGGKSLFYGTQLFCCTTATGRIGQAHDNAPLVLLQAPYDQDDFTLLSLDMQVLEFPKIQSLIWGGKGVGSQGDGTAQLLCKGEAEQRQV